MQFGRVSLGSTMRTHEGYDARDYYEHAGNAMGGNVYNGNDDIDYNGRRFQETPSYVVATMRSLIKAQEEKHQLNASMLQSLTNLQRKIYSGWGTTRIDGSKCSTRRRRRTSSGSSDSQESSGDTSSSSRKRKRRRHHRDHSWDEMRLKWKQFKKYFKQKYLSGMYYDDKIKEFYEMKLGQWTME